jgi:hypothetical protein
MPLTLAAFLYVLLRVFICSIESKSNEDRRNEDRRNSSGAGRSGLSQVQVIYYIQDFSQDST